MVHHTNGTEPACYTNTSGVHARAKSVRVSPFGGRPTNEKQPRTRAIAAHASPHTVPINNRTRRTLVDHRPAKSASSQPPVKVVPYIEFRKGFGELRDRSRFLNWDIL